MEAELGFLQYLIHEEIYLLRSEKATSAPISAEAAPAAVSKPAVVMPSTAVLTTDSPTISIPKPSITPAITPSKNILIVYHFSGTEKLPPHLKTLMLKILEAINVDVKGADFVNDAFKPVPAPQHYHNVLVFNPKPTTLASDIDAKLPYTVQQHNATRIMIADTLDTLDKDKTLKVKLWGMLKKMFAVA